MSALSGLQTPLAQAHDVALLDLDGVVYVGAHAVENAPAALAQARQRHGMRTAFVTNNASRTPVSVAAHLRDLGVEARAEDVVTSAQAGARVLRESGVPVGAKVLAVGGPGVAAALEERGFLPVFTADDAPVAVMQGYGPDVGWRDLAEASLALDRGALWVATNTDRTIPSPRGRVLGNGSLVAALRHATGVVPLVAGKPEEPLMLESIERTAAQSPLVVGDRLDTDIEGANRCGVPSLLVLTGVTDWHDLLHIPAALRPTFLSADLRGLLESAPHVEVHEGAAASGQAAGHARFEARCRAARVVVEEVTPEGSPNAARGIGAVSGGSVDARAVSAGSVGEGAPGAPGHAPSLPRMPDFLPLAWGEALDEQVLDCIRAVVSVTWFLADRGLRARALDVTVG